MNPIDPRDPMHLSFRSAVEREPLPRARVSRLTAAGVIVVILWAMLLVVLALRPSH